MQVTHKQQNEDFYAKFMSDSLALHINRIYKKWILFLQIPIMS